MFTYISKTSRRIEPIHGPVFRFAREVRGLSQGQLAKQLEVDRSYVTKIETGHSLNVSVEFYNRALRALDISDYRVLLVNPNDRIIADRSDSLSTSAKGVA